MFSKKKRMPVTPREVLEALREIDLPPDRRRSVRRSDAHQKKGMCLGYVIQYDKGWVLSRWSTKYPELSRLLCRFASERFPDFRFSSIMVNSGASALHVDQGNCGPSLIVSLGDHVGGDLWQFPDTQLRVKDRLVPCEGRLPHITMPFEGERYSVVYFNMKGDREGPESGQRRFLRQCGFHKPPKVPMDAIGARTDLLPVAARLLRKHWGLSKKYIGDFTNKSLRPTIRMWLPETH
jgi:hypothetical protein